MSVNFEWPSFSEAFYTDAREMLAQVSSPFLVAPVQFRLNLPRSRPTVFQSSVTTRAYSQTVPDHSHHTPGAEQRPETPHHRRQNRSTRTQHGNYRSSHRTTLRVLRILTLRCTTATGIGNTRDWGFINGSLSRNLSINVRWRRLYRPTHQSTGSYITLHSLHGMLTQSQKANPLNVPRPSLDIIGSPRMVFAAAPLVVPMTLRLSSLSLRAIVVLVVSRQKGITLVFKNDPLESVQVSSSFDGVESVAGYIQREIEGQLREAFRSDLPAIIHRLSQKWLSGEVKTATEDANGVGTGFDKDAKIETRTSYLNDEGEKARRGLTTQMANLNVGPESFAIGSDVDTSFSASVAGGQRNYARSFHSKRSTPATPIKPVVEDFSHSISDPADVYDPTYGLRPDISISQDFSDHERSRSSRGSRRDIDELDAHDDEMDSHWDGIVRTRLEQSRLQSTPTRLRRPSELDSRYSYDTLLGSASTATFRHCGEGSSNATTGARSAAGGRTGSAPVGFSAVDGSVEYLRSMASGSSTPRFPFSSYDRGTAGFPSLPSMHRTHSLPGSSRQRATPQRSNLASWYSSADPETRFESAQASSYSSPASSIPSPPEETPIPSYPAKRPDALELLSRSPSSLFDTSFEDDQPITLHPDKNEACALISALTKTNQTLSPFTASHEFFTARSIPNVVNRFGVAARGAGNTGTTKGSETPSTANNIPIKAKRKRLHRVGAAKLVVPTPPLDARGRGNSGGSSEQLRAENFSPAGSAGLQSYAPSELSEYFPSRNMSKADILRGMNLTRERFL